VPLVVVAVLAGCGSEEQPDGDSASDGRTSASPTPSSSASPDACDQSEEGIVVTRNLAKVDVDGDGTRDQVGLVEPATSECPPMVSVNLAAGSVGPGVLAPIPAGEPPVRAAFAVAIPGHTGELVVTRQVHPRGGFQTRVFALAGDELVQLEVDGRPLVPFVATDVQEHPVSIDCGDNLITVTEAVAHEPAGVMFAWDVKETTYALQGATVTAGPTREVADNVLPAQLKERFPELGKNAVFPSCRVS
jgi:hypothetical protein